MAGLKVRKFGWIFIRVCMLYNAINMRLELPPKCWIVASLSRFDIGCGRWGCHCRCHTCFENWWHIFFSVRQTTKVFIHIWSGVIAFPKFPNKLLQITKPFIHLSAKPLTLASLLFGFKLESAMPNNYIRWHFCLFIIWQHERIIP